MDLRPKRKRRVWGDVSVNVPIGEGSFIRVKRDVC